MLGVEPEELSVHLWKSFAQHWQSYNKTSTPTQAYCFHMNEVFANCSDGDEIYPLTTEEIAEAQRADTSLKHLFKPNAVIDQGLEIKLIENMTCVCKYGRLVIPKPLQVDAIKLYHQCLQHPGHLSWVCRQHVGDTLATCQKVAKFGSTRNFLPTQKVPQHKNFASEITHKL
jgi:hypothetical protein